MKESVKFEFEKLVKSINDANCSLSLSEQLLVSSSCFNKSCGDYSIDIKSFIIHSDDFLRIFSLVTKYDCHMFISSSNDMVVLDIQ